MSSTEESYALDENDVQQAMVLNRVSTRMLHQFLGLTSAARSTPSALFLVELINHSDDPAAVRAHVEEFGRAEGERLLGAMRPVICDEWNYCGRRATGGFGDPRHLLTALASVVGPKLCAGGRAESEKTFLMCVCLFLMRSRLGELCRCGEDGADV